MLRFLVHYGIHFVVPIAIAFLFFKERKMGVALLLLSGLLIDIDHLWATPIFDPDRCSIGFHPLHSYWAIMGYAVLPFFKKTRLIGLALLLHIVADMIDCLLL